MAIGRKTGGRIAGVSKNKPKPIKLEPTEENRELVAMAQLMRTPKAVMLDAMMRFENLGLGFLAKADKMMKTRAAPAKVAEVAQDGHKFIVAAVECATKAAPYVHARLLAIESRGDMTEDKAPYVVRVPAVLSDSKAWQMAVGAELLEEEAARAARAASDAKAGVLPHPARVQAVAADQPPAPAPVALVADQKTGRITAMPVAPKPVMPAGSEEWLAAVQAERRKVAG